MVHFRRWKDSVCIFTRDRFHRCIKKDRYSSRHFASWRQNEKKAQVFVAKASVRGVGAERPDWAASPLGRPSPAHHSPSSPPLPSSPPPPFNCSPLTNRSSTKGTLKKIAWWHSHTRSQTFLHRKLKNFPPLIRYFEAKLSGATL